MRKTTHYLLTIVLIQSCFMFTGCKNVEYSPEKEKKAFILELNQDGEEVWNNKDYVDPNCYNKTKEGNRIICDAYNYCIYELNKNDEIIKIFPSIMSNYTEKTDHNTYLISSTINSIGAREVDNFGETIWEKTNLSNTIEAHKIDQNTYLIAEMENKAITFFDKNNNIIWEMKNKVAPSSIQYLPNENFLIANSLDKNVIEITKNGNITWEFKYNNEEPTAARKLNDDKYVIGYKNGTILIVNKEGKILKQIKKLSYLSSLVILPDGNIGITGIKQKLNTLF